MKVFFSLAMLALALCAGSLQAENIRIPIGQQGQESSIAVPSTGMKKADVEAKFGAPNSKTEPVGNPPISRWSYDKFVVYFEYDHVVRSVKVFKPQLQQSQQPDAE